jgi:hypothetical protein
MFHRISIQPFLMSATILLGCLTGLQGAGRDKHQLCFVCVSSLPGEQEIVIASRNDKGRWKEYGEVGLRASGITDWFPAAAGELHLAQRENNALKSICSFQFPAGSKRALVVLAADTETNSYKAHVLDPEKIGFDKGSVLVVNLSEKNALVALGTNERQIKPGQQAVIKPGKEEDITYRQMVSYFDDKDKEVLSHDRHVPLNPDVREMLFLLTDKTLGLRVATLPVFGTLD